MPTPNGVNYLLQSLQRFFENFADFLEQESKVDVLSYVFFIFSQPIGIIIALKGYTFYYLCQSMFDVGNIGIKSDSSKFSGEKVWKFGKSLVSLQRCLIINSNKYGNEQRVYYRRNIW